MTTRRAALVIAVLIAVLWPVRAAAFALEGHEVIEATAYKRLLAMDVVPGTAPAVSGRTLLASLIATGVLLRPPCFDRSQPEGDCGPSERLEQPLGYWPHLGSGGPDLVIDRQLGQRGQCQHFMARTGDGLGPVDPRFGVPGALATEAYLRCVRLAGAAFDLILRDPYLAHQRLAGTYALMHALEDSYSAAHVDRDAQYRIVHLLSWKLIDWPSAYAHGQGHFPAATHHGITDDRDGDYLEGKVTTPDGLSCRSFHHPYAVPEVCLTPRAKAAATAVTAFLVALYQLRARAALAGKTVSLFSSDDEPRKVWRAYVAEHFASVAAAPELPAEPQSALPRPDIFLGLQAVLGRGTRGLGIWHAKLFFVRPVVPFALGLTAGAGYERTEGVGTLTAGAGLSLLLPLVRRFTIGASPVGVRFSCETDVLDCSVGVIATAGLLLVPLGDHTWLGLQGPQYSWTTRTWSDTWGGFALGWSHERAPRPQPLDPDASATWDPPRPDEVRGYRMTRSTRALYLSATVASQPDNHFVGAGVDWRWDRDRWNRRSGFCPGVQAEAYEGAIDETKRAGGVALAPTLRAYLIANRIAVVATPALLRFGALGDGAIGGDVAAQAGVTVAVGQLELGVVSSPFSYVSRDRWHSFPVAIRLAALLD